MPEGRGAREILSRITHRLLPPAPHDRVHIAEREELDEVMGNILENFDDRLNNFDARLLAIEQALGNDQLKGRAGTT